MTTLCESGSSLALFHPVIQDWFHSRFAGPTEPQQQGWPEIVAGRDILIAAPTGSGKTLTSFLAAIDRLFQLSEQGSLTNEIRVVYISPLRALSNDMQRNLEQPLAEILALAAERGREVPPIRVGLRTGDTPAAKRAAMLRRPPHILVTTPESLYLMLTSPKSRETLRNVETVIVDEILGRPAPFGQFGQASAGNALPMIQDLFHGSLKEIRPKLFNQLLHTPFTSAAGGDLGVHVAHRAIRQAAIKTNHR